MSKRWIGLSFMLLCLLSGQAWAAAPEQNSDRVFTPAEFNAPETVEPRLEKLTGHVYANYTSRRYILGPNDIISINVFDSPEFSQQNVLVQPDGNITMAPFGTINLAGMTLDQTQQELTEKLKYYLNDPKVTVRLEKSKPFNVYVSGAVVKPGAYELVTDVTRNQTTIDNTPEVMVERKSPLLSNILVAAGGVDTDADLEHVQIKNKIDGSSYEVNVLELIASGDSSQDLYLIAGDSVHVPRLSTPLAVDDAKYGLLAGSTVFQKQIPVKVYGFVNRPGLVNLDSAQSANLHSAIASAGGYLTANAYAPKHVMVSRVDGNGRLVTTKVDPRYSDMMLRPNDIVYVPEQTRPKIGKAFDYITRIAAPFGAIGGAVNSWALLFDPTRFQVRVGAN